MCFYVMPYRLHVPPAQVQTRCVCLLLCKVTATVVLVLVPARGGFYTTLIRKGLRVVSLNMNYCYDLNW